MIATYDPRSLELIINGVRVDVPSVNRIGRPFTARGRKSRVKPLTPKPEAAVKS